MFGNSVASGDHVGLALVPVNLRNFSASKGWSILGPSSKTTVTEYYIQTLVDDEQRNLRMRTADATGERFGERGQYHVWQWLPTINSIIVKEFWDLFPSEAEREPVQRGSRYSGAPKVDFIEHIHLGTVSNSLMRNKCRKRQMIASPFETNTYTLCPQIEVLLA